ncbi:hypothetical protein EVAR_14522_1 [Eumeta japonica]|uniref:Uncharacterized protein n=1 Tax=Eumeta variegata TaxID=151549 RepID=A0A4C1U4N8_EUMVA|nr:hypothetical protein EVAR_14522_1 [Eumeta japonica]
MVINSALTTTLGSRRCTITFIVFVADVQLWSFFEVSSSERTRTRAKTRSSGRERRELVKPEEYDSIHHANAHAPADARGPPLDSDIFTISRDSALDKITITPRVHKTKNVARAPPLLRFTFASPLRCPLLMLRMPPQSFAKPDSKMEQPRLTSLTKAM